MPTKPGHISSDRARELAAKRKRNGAGNSQGKGGRPRVADPVRPYRDRRKKPAA